MARRKKREIPELKGNWLTTYGDMVTLLLTFFVFLYSFSTIDVQKFSENDLLVSKCNRSAAWGVIAIPGEETLQGAQFTGPGQEMTLNAEQMKKVHEMMVELLEAEKLTKEVAVRLEERGIVISIMDGGVI